MASANVSSCDPFCFALHEVGKEIVFLPETQSERIKSLVSGVLAGLACFLIASTAMYLLKKYVPGFSLSQDSARIFNLFKNVHPILNSAWKAVWRGFVVLGGPVLEEYLFRGLIFGGIKKIQGENASTIIQTIMRIALVSLIFGACHLSPFQSGLTNLVVFGVSTVIGIVLAILKECRKDLLSPAAAHIIYNLGATI